MHLLPPHLREIMHVRYIDDGFLVWTGTLVQLTALQAELAAVDPANLAFTWDVDSKLAVFLDLEVFKGPGWRRSGLLDTRCFQKATNKYLYLPFTTETPLHILSGFITGESSSSYRRALSEVKIIFKYSEEIWSELIFSFE